MRAKKQIVPKPKESEILKQITDYLSAEKIWYMRMNTGAMFGSHKGKGWAVRFSKKGTADILAWKRSNGYGNGGNMIWIECKRPGGKQSPEQLEFQREVNEQGHHYILADSFGIVKVYLERWLSRA